VEPMKESRMKGADFTDLSSEILKEGNSIRFKARGSSMLPWIKDGDMLTVQPITENEIRVGQVVFYPSKGEKPVVHRVLQIRFKGAKRILLTRGDASPKSEEQIEASKVLGKVVRIHRGSKVIQLERNLWWRLVRKWPTISRLSYALVRFQRRFQRYVLLSPKGSSRKTGD
jgi:signal peptidase